MKAEFSNKQPEPVERTIAHVRVKLLLVSCGGVQHTRKEDGRMAYLMPNMSVVLMPPGHARMPESLVREIAEIKCEMSTWQYDYWLTNQDRGSNYTAPKRKKRK